MGSRCGLLPAGFPKLSLILRCRVSGLEGDFQGAKRWLEPSFEASASLRHLRMRMWVGMCVLRPLPHQIAAQIVRLAHRGREADRHGLRCQRTQPREGQRQQVAALRDDERVQFVEHDLFQATEKLRGLAVGEQQRKLLGRGQQDVGGPGDLPGALVGGRVAGASLDRDRQIHLGDRGFEIAGDVDRERLQRRHVKRVQAPCRARALRQGHQRRQEAGQGLAGPGRRDEKRRSASSGILQQGELMGPRLPAACGEPVEEAGRKWGEHGVRFVARGTPPPA